MKLIDVKFIDLRFAGWQVGGSRKGIRSSFHELHVLMLNDNFLDSP